MEDFFLHSQLVFTLSALILATAFYLLSRKRMLSLVNAFAFQSILLAVATAIQAHVLGHPLLYFSAALTFCLKAIGIPWIMRYLIVQFNIQKEDKPIAHPFYILLGAAALVLFSYYIITPLSLFSSLSAKNIIVIAMAVMFLGLFLMIVRCEAIAHVIGFMEMENGLFYAALMSTAGMPMTVELGIAFDILVAIILFGIFFFHIRTSIDSLDVDRLNLLREDVDW